MLLHSVLIVVGFFNTYRVMKWKRKLLPKTNNADSSNNPIFVPFHLCHYDESLRTSIPSDSSHIRPTIEPFVVTPQVVQPDIRCPLQLLNFISESPIEGIQDSASGCLKRKSPPSSSRDAFSRYSELYGRSVLTKCSLDITPAVEHPNFEKYSDLCRTNAVTGTSKPSMYVVRDTPVVNSQPNDSSHIRPTIEPSVVTPQVVQPDIRRPLQLLNSIFKSPVEGCLKHKSLPSSSRDAFSRYSELCKRSPYVHVVRDTTVVNSQHSLSEPLRLNITERDALLDDRTHLNIPIGGVFRLNDGAYSSGQSEDSVLFDGIIDNVSKKRQRNATVVESSSKKPRYTAPRATYRWIANVTHDDGEGCSSGRLYGYVDLGDCNQQCQYCGAAFWFGKHLKGHSNYRMPKYHLCCWGGRIHMQPSEDLPEYFKNLLQNKHFMENIRAYNQMFAMTSFGAQIDESINHERGPYVFKVSGQVYHWIGSLCPPPGESLRFLQLYIYDTDHEVENRMRHFGGIDDINLDPEIVKGARGYELPTSNVLGAVVFDSGVSGSTDFDVIIQEKAGPPKRISKLYKSYMSLQFPLLFIYGQHGFYLNLKLRTTDGSRQEQKLTMLAYYSYQFHPRVKDYNLIFRTGRLFQQYVVGVYYAIEQSRDGYEVGGRIILLMSFTGGPRYMYAHYLDALAICRKLGNPRFFITFTCNVNWPEIKSFVYGGVSKKGFTTLSYLTVGPFREQDKRGSISKMSAPCMKCDKCSKNFPKKYTSHTFFNDKGQVHYQRRDTSISTTKHHFSLDNSYVVPYNRASLLAFEAHINVEYCRWSMLIKYLFKYISKGTDRIFARVSNPLGESSNVPGMQRITFRDRDNLESIVNLPGQTSTILTEWFTYNEANEDGGHLTYQDFPSKFVWYADRKSWSRRRNSKSSIGRLAYVHPTSGELFYFRILLCHKKGCTQFIDVQMINDVFYPTYRELRFVFAHILTHCDVTYPSKLWGKYWSEMGHDIPEKVSERVTYGRKNYNQQELMQERDESALKLNTQQRKIYDLIIDANLKKQQELIFVYGHEGTASSGIASLLLPLGRTAHSRFKLPLELTKESLCRITKNSHLGKLLANIDLIIWDEAPMNDRRCFEALDRSLRDILTEPHSLFGGKSVLLELWSQFKVFTLTENMRLEKPNISADEHSMISSFASWLLNIGDGNMGDLDPEDPKNTSWVDIPINYLTLQQKVIVCPKNETADMINSKVLEMVQGETKIYLSHDEARPVDNDGAETEMLYPVEHLNTLKLLGYPPHRLELKVWASVMLLWNVNVAGGKWTAKSLPDLTPIAFCCILIDQEIQSNMNIKDIDYFNRILQIGSAYRISNFICEPTSSYQQTLENKTSLHFGRFTKFDNIPATTFPYHYFEFTSYNRLESKIPKPDNNNKMQYPVLTDYIGCIRSVSGITHFKYPNRSEKTLRKIDIENLNGNIIELTLWDEMAEHFGQAKLETMEQPVIIAVSSCCVSKYRDYQLTATPATFYYLNPKIPEAETSRDL
nr:DNA helicase [Tanacetum cinerariifolium]